MGSTMVGMSAHGGVLPAGGTFFVFLDYMRPPVRLASITGTKVFFVFTHDSVGVGEDGPTHQPVEQLATLRAIPQLQVIRPADANETVAALRAAVAHEGPTAFVLSRQNIQVCTDGSAVERGAGVVVAGDDPQVVLVGTGSEVAVCVDAAARLADAGTPHPRRQPAVVGPLRGPVRRVPGRRCCRPACRSLSVEAGVTFGWARWADASIGIDRFGVSAPGAEVLDKLGINVDHVVDAATTLISPA